MLRKQSEAENENHAIPYDDRALRDEAAGPFISCRGRLIGAAGRTLIMGILNVTPDSFYDGGRYLGIDSALRHTENMVNEGADIIDVGGESTRPGSEGVSLDEELSRVIPVIRGIKERFDVMLSIDTTKSGVAREALAEGASIVNDISGLKFGTGVAREAARFGAGLVLTHTTSRPKDMQEKTEYVSIVDDIIASLAQSMRMAADAGVGSGSIAVDPGFGFGKTPAQNLFILRHLKRFRELGRPVLIGTSNKSFIGSTLGGSPGDRLEGTAATVAIGIVNGASIVRVHDVGRMRRVALMADAVRNIN